jgi:pSer/pThr/pTyr-binding forkhead associated (FHA) protein
MEDESTLRLETGRNAPWIDTGLELRVIDAHGRESTWPICRASMTIGRFGSPQASDIVLDDPGVAGRQAMLQYRNKKVMFLNLNDAKPATREGKDVGLVELVPGQEIVISGQRLQLVERQPAAACLVGYSPPFRGRRWLLHSGEHAVGRAGRRENQILINDRTVSREHAVLTADAQGYRLRVEASSAPTYLNGHPVEGEAALKDGDLLQFGNQLVRLQIGSASARASSMQTLPATVLYADVSNCEKLLAERPMDEMVRQMADYYEMVDRVVSEGSGRLTTYLGDAAVALFDDEAAAVQAALTLCRHIDQMNDLWRQVGCGGRPEPGGPFRFCGGGRAGRSGRADRAADPAQKGAHFAERHHRPGGRPAVGPAQPGHEPDQRDFAGAVCSSLGPGRNANIRALNRAFLR